MWEFQWPWLGILIPCITIACISTCSHVLVFRHHMAPDTQTQYSVLVTLVWISYYMAVTTPPGSPRRTENSGENAETAPGPASGRWCSKCHVYKPERAHHCRKCGVCVLAMDHHCPWIDNCVGHGNLPHFMRFLVCTQVALGVTLWHLVKRLAVYYEDMHMPAYLLPKGEMAAVLVLVPLSAFVLLAIFLLFVRCVLHLVSGKTQIEVWEYERIASQFHTERLWLRIRDNYRRVHGSDLGPLVSWNKPSDSHFGPGSDVPEEAVSEEKTDASDSVVPSNFTPDDLVFPYDMGLVQNFTNALGPVYTWVLPWGKAKGDGMHFPKNDDDDQLNLPWPPDGGASDYAPRVYSDDELRSMRSVQLIKKHLDPRSNMSRVQWTNDMGEGLADFGVDVEADEELQREIHEESTRAEEIGE